MILHSVKKRKSPRGCSEPARTCEQGGAKQAAWHAAERTRSRADEYGLLAKFTGNSSAAHNDRASIFAISRQKCRESPALALTLQLILDREDSPAPLQTSSA